jgi:hypothetical protein
LNPDIKIVLFRIVAEFARKGGPGERSEKGDTGVVGGRECWCLGIVEKGDGWTGRREEEMETQVEPSKGKKRKRNKEVSSKQEGKKNRAIRS